MTAHVYAHCSDEEFTEPYRYTACGLDDVYLLNGYRTYDDPDYGQGISVKDLEALHKAIGLNLVRNKKILTGKQLRFLRGQMDITQSELGRLVGMSAQQVARWEKDQSNINPAADRVLRMLYQEQCGGDLQIRELLELLDEMDDSLNGDQVFETDDGGWRASA